MSDITWSSGPRLPKRVKVQAQAVVDGRIVYSGGFAFDASGYTRPPTSATREEVMRLRTPRRIRYCRETWMFDPVTQKFQRLPDAPVGVFYPQGVGLGRDFYMLTGTMRNPENLFTKEAWRQRENRDVTSPRIFRLREEGGGWKWSELPPMRFGRFLPGVALIDTTLYVIAGKSSFGAAARGGDQIGPNISAVEAIDLARPKRGWRDIAPLPGMARSTPIVSVAAGKLYVFGGYGDLIYQRPQNEDFGDAHGYDAATRSSDQLPDMPFTLAAAPAVTVDDRYVLFVGGIRGLRRSDRPKPPLSGDHGDEPRANLETIVFDTREQLYHILPTKLPPAPDDPLQRDAPTNYWNGPGASLIGDSVYLLGGDILDLAYSNCTDVIWTGKLVRSP